MLPPPARAASWAPPDRTEVLSLGAGRLVKRGSRVSDAVVPSGSYPSVTAVPLVEADAFESVIASSCMSSSPDV